MSAYIDLDRILSREESALTAAQQAIAHIQAAHPEPRLSASQRVILVDVIATLLLDVIERLEQGNASGD